MSRAVRAGVFLLCLLPFLWLLAGALTSRLGADPAQALMHSTGEWALRLLALTLLMAPVRAFAGGLLSLRLRRMFGLYAFFYACLHLVLFIHFYIGWTALRLAEELAERPYITAGFGAWLLLLPLALTSTRGMQRRLRANWARLHRLVYPAVVCACLHLVWQARSDLGEALFYCVVFGALLGWRVWRRLRRPHARPARS